MNDAQTERLHAELTLLMVESERLHVALEGISLRVTAIARSLAALSAAEQPQRAPHQPVYPWRQVA